MALEIERKFLLKENENFPKENPTKIIQGYILNSKKKTVRVRMNEKNCFITIKGKSNNSGTTRFEWEKEISFEDCKNLLKLCDGNFIEKIRYSIHINNFIFEIDEFLGKNKGLVLIELELQNENQDYPRPQWLGNEVTGDNKFYNSNLSKNPYNSW